ncbi:radical SAM protein [Flavonifractor plautii]|nr:radical SAM protein [Flavonifractor plautii]
MTPSWMPCAGSWPPRGPCWRMRGCGCAPSTSAAEPHYPLRPQLDRLMGELADHIDLSGCTEYTVEAGRPDTITAEKLAVLARRGCSRVSVNPQTMQDAVLERMGRAHRADDILRAYALARESGIGCINMDLIAGLPGDSAAGFRASLDAVLALAPENVTVHTLALKKGSRLMEEGAACPPERRWRICWTTPGPPCGPGRGPTTSTARSTCPAPLRTWAGAYPAPRASTTSA